MSTRLPYRAETGNSGAGPSARYSGIGPTQHPDGDPPVWPPPDLCGRFVIMTAQVVDYFCNVFTPQGLKKVFLDNPEVGAVLKWWNIEDRIKGHSPEAFIDVLDVQFMNSRGIGKVMWGTDYPILLHKESLDQVDQLDLKPEDREALMWKTALEVFKL